MAASWQLRWRVARNVHYQIVTTVQSEAKVSIRLDRITSQHAESSKRADDGLKERHNVVRTVYNFYTEILAERINNQPDKPRVINHPAPKLLSRRRQNRPSLKKECTCVKPPSTRKQAGGHEHSADKERWERPKRPVATRRQLHSPEPMKK